MIVGLACGVQGGVSAATGTRPSTDVAPATITFDSCSWNRPGVNPFMGDVVAAVDRYRDIPADVRARLKARMVKRAYDDLVRIRRDSIDGRGGHDYGNNISQMHFGTHQLCRSVTRAAWSPSMEERGLVYCDSGHCILVPTVCRNVSRITRKGVGGEVAEDLSPFAAPPLGALPGVGDLAAQGAPLAMGDLPPIDWFGSTGAGLPADALPPVGGGGFGGIVPGGSIAFAGVTPSPGPTITTSAAPPGESDGPGLPPLTPVPEPQTWAMMLGGLAALVAVRRRSRQAASNGRR